MIGDFFQIGCPGYPERKKHAVEHVRRIQEPQIKRLGQQIGRKRISETDQQQEKLLGHKHCALPRPINDVAKKRPEYHTESGGHKKQKRHRAHRHAMDLYEHPGAEHDEDLLAHAKKGANRVKKGVFAFKHEPAAPPTLLVRHPDTKIQDAGHYRT